jgi:CubicO group peptidase (beta-lactamase class C family)
MPFTTSLDRRRLLAALTALAAAPGAARAAEAGYPSVRAFLEKYRKAGAFSGGVVAIQRRGHAPDFVSVGTLAFENQAPIDPASLFRVYSMTKPITGAAAMTLVEDGKLKLDQPLSDILPDFKSMSVVVGGDPAKTRPAAGPILIRHLLTHTSGLSYNIDDRSPLAKVYLMNGLAPGGRDTQPLLPGGLPPAKDLDEFGARLAKLPLDFDPGTKWQYSVAADLMGLVIQRVSGKSFWEFLSSRLFEPLQMPDTDFMVPASKVARLTTVYAKTKDGVVASDPGSAASPFARDRDLPSGGGGLVASTRDYARFNAMLLNEGELDGRRVLKAATVRLARSNLMPPGVAFDAFSPGKANGFGAFMQVVLPGGQLFPGSEPPGSYGWSGAAGTTMWIDPTNALAVSCMVQFFPSGAYPVYLDSRLSTYGDLGIKP